MFFKRIQLGLIHVAVAMTLVPINSTLNRVMIKELAISATVVALLASLPYLFSPIQVAIGSFSDRHPVFGYRRSPYILLGLLLCILGLVIAPQAAFRMAESPWTGVALGLLAFGAWGMGYNFSSVSYLALASELSGDKGRGRTVAVMWFMMITSIILTSLTLGGLLEPYSPAALQRAFWIVGLVALGLGVAGLVRLESRFTRSTARGEGPSWRQSFQAILENRQATLFFFYLIILLAAILGQDILLEPYGGEAFGLTVTQTTRITSIWGTSFLLALIIAGLLENRVHKRSVARWGGRIALAGFLLIAGSGLVRDTSLFYTGVVALGLGSGLSTVSNLSLMLDMTTADKVGLFIGAWGMANAVSRLIGTVLGGVVRDVVTQLVQNPVTGYVLVFGIEAALLGLSLLLLGRIDVQTFQRQAGQPSLVERAAITSEV